MAKNKKLVDKLEIDNWNFSKERVFTENLFIGRFNYFIIIYSLFLTAGFVNNFSNYRYLVFYLGLIILSACWIPLFRGFKKHDKILKILFREKKDHPAAVLEKIMKMDCYRPFFRVSYWMGIYIPLMCVTSLLIIGVLIHLNIIN